MTGGSLPTPKPEFINSLEDFGPAAPAGEGAVETQILNACLKAGLFVSSACARVATLGRARKAKLPIL